MYFAIQILPQASFILVWCHAFNAVPHAFYVLVWSHASNLMPRASCSISMVSCFQYNATCLL